MKTFRYSLTAVVLLLSASAVVRADETEVNFRITGLFSPDREADLKKAMETVPEVQLVSVDYKLAEARFKFDAAKAFPGTKPDKFQERVDNLVRNATRSTFGVKPLSN